MVATLGDSSLMSNNIRFQTDDHAEENHLKILDKMMNPQDFLTFLQNRDKGRHDFRVPKVEDLNIHFYTEPVSESKKLYIAPNYDIFPKDNPLRDWFGTHKRMHVGETGYKTACNLIERTPDVFSNFSDPDTRFINEFRDWFRHGREKGILIRTGSVIGVNHGDRMVDAVLDHKFDTTSNYLLIHALMERVMQVYGDCVRGVQVLTRDSKYTEKFRVLFGSPILQETKIDPLKILFVMVDFQANDYGLSSVKASLGLWRMICANGMMRDDIKMLNATWNRFDSPKEFIKKLQSVISLAGSFGNVMTEKMLEIQNTPLRDHPIEVMNSMVGQDLISGKVGRIAINHLKSTEAKTCYDMLNVLTDSAKSIRSLSGRSRAESNALMLAMQSESYNGVMVRGIDKSAAAGDLAELKEIESFN